MNIGESFVHAANNGHYRSMPADFRSYVQSGRRLRDEDVELYIERSSLAYYQKKRWFHDVKENYVHDDGSYFSKQTLIHYLKMELQNRGILDFNIGAGGSVKSDTEEWQ